MSRKGTGTGYQHVLAAKSLRQAAGAVVGERFRHAEHHDERQHGGAGGQVELLLRDGRQDAALQAHHGTDEAIHDDQQRELPQILAQPEPRADGGC